MKQHMGTTVFALALFGVSTLGACTGDGSTEAVSADGGVGEVETLKVSGTLVDFSTGEPLSSGTLSTDGLSPAPTISVTGAEFEIDNVPPYSNFHLLAGSPPDYRSTYSAIVETEEADLSGLEVATLSEDFIDELYASFGVSVSAGTSLVVARLVDEEGNPAAGIPAGAFQLEANMEGPFFLDADRKPDAALNESSSSGYAVVFNVSPGLVSFTAAEGANLSLLMADSPVSDRAATLAEILVQDGEIVVPTDVSFAQDVAPIFENRGCVLCHAGGGVGKDLGGLHLNGEPQKMYKEVAEEISGRHGTIRVNLETPEESLLLTLPSKEDPPDIHPNSTFLSNADPDYLIILGWIREGALNN